MQFITITMQPHPARWPAIIAVFALGSLPLHITASGQVPVRQEAEEQVLGGDAEIITNALASQGLGVALGRTGSVGWRVAAPAAGRYKLWLRYCAEGGDKAELLAVNGRNLGIGLPSTTGEWAEISFIRTLDAGTNSIILRADWAGLEVDYLRFDFIGRGEAHPLFEYPIVSPGKNLRYLNNPAEMRLKVDLGGHRLRSIVGKDRDIYFAQERCDYLDDSVRVHVPAAEFEGLNPGLHRWMLRFDDDIEVPCQVEIRRKPGPSPWTIVTLDVNHGGATFMRLPDGKTLLLDTAKAEEADRVVIPFLRSNHIDKLDYLIVTHYHEDHAGGLPAIRKQVKIGQERDYKSYRSGDEFEAGGVRVEVLNAFEDGADENTRSLALRFEYRRFVYTHGADNYAQNQIRQLEQFPGTTLRSHVYHANHHFHGSVDAGFLRAVDPVLVLVSAEKAVYARGAYTTVYRQDAESYLRDARRRFDETLVTYDVGHVVLRITDGEKWTWETTPALEGIVLR